MRSRRLFLLFAVCCLAATGALAAHPAAHPAAQTEGVPADEAVSEARESVLRRIRQRLEVQP